MTTKSMTLRELMAAPSWADVERRMGWDEDLADLPTEQILMRIRYHQNQQKRVPPTSPEWQDESDMLAPLFAEMARRQGQC